MTRLLAKQFDQRCPKQFVLVGLRPYKYRRKPFDAFPKSYVGMPKLLGVAFDEAWVADEICFVCGRGNDLRSDSEEECVQASFNLTLQLKSPEIQLKNYDEIALIKDKEQK